MMDLGSSHLTGLRGSPSSVWASEWQRAILYWQGSRGCWSPCGPSTQAAFSCTPNTLTLGGLPGSSHGLIISNPFEICVHKCQDPSPRARPYPGLPVIPLASFIERICSLKSYLWTLI